jgi:hypothetical protein
MYIRTSHVVSNGDGETIKAFIVVVAMNLPPPASFWGDISHPGGDKKEQVQTTYTRGIFFWG